MKTRVREACREQGSIHKWFFGEDRTLPSCIRLAHLMVQQEQVKKHQKAKAHDPAPYYAWSKDNA